MFYFGASPHPTNQKQHGKHEGDFGTWQLTLYVVLSTIFREPLTRCTFVHLHEFAVVMHLPRILRPVRLLKQDWQNLRSRYVSDWTIFNQLIVASAVYVLFTNLLPGITFASDLYVLTGKSWGTVEVVFSTGLCGIIFSLCERNDLFSCSHAGSSAQILYTASDNTWCDWTLFRTCRKHLLIVYQLLRCRSSMMYL